MKKKLAIILSTLVLAVSLVGCSNVTVETTYDPDAEELIPSMFVAVEDASIWEIVYHRETKVMYAVSCGSYNCGTFTLLVDENGDPLLYEGE